MIKKILKFFLILLLSLSAACGVFLLVYYEQWPWWTGILILSGIGGVAFGVWFLKRYLLRRRERKFVQRVVEIDEAAIKTAPVNEREQLKELQSHWMQSIETLRGSHLRKRGNPLYALPWYLVIGESGSGKTSAIRTAGLNSPLNDDHRSATISATRNCDWWFFQEAVVLDSAGRYTIPIDEEPDKEEWKKFLALLAKYRKKEPLNGVIVAIPADALLKTDGNKLRQDGQSIRQRIDQLMRVTGARFPVYFLVTKMDLVHGFVEFFDLLPDELASQAMGSMNRDQSMFWKEFLEGAFEEVSLRLKELRVLLADQATGRPRPELLMFPREFEQLKQGMEIFARAVLEENPYQASPFLRGVFFSSARQEGRPAPETSRLIGTLPASRASERGFFLKDIFRDLLPSDRSLFSPLPEFLRWSYLTRSIGLVSWFLIWTAMCGMISLTFLHNLSALDHFSNDHKFKVSLSGGLASDILQLARLRHSILGVEEDNDRWYLPRFGIDADLQIEQELKKEYAVLFRIFWRPFYSGLLLRIENVQPNTSEKLITDYMGYVVVQTKLLRSLSAGEKDRPVELFKKAAANMMKHENPEIPPEITAKLGDVLYSYLLWSDDEMGIANILETSESTMANLQGKSSKLEWLVYNWIPNAPDISLDRFWGDAPGEEMFMVPAAYTSEGRKNIQDFIAIMESVLEDKTSFAAKKSEFWHWYEQKFYAEWADFLANFGRGAKVRRDHAAMQHTAALMSTTQNPYFNLLDYASTEISAMPANSRPPWADLVVILNEIRKGAQMLEKKDEKKPITYKIRDFKDRVVSEVKQDAGPDDAKLTEQKIAIAKLWAEYEKSLESLAPIATSRQMCFRMASDYFAVQASADDNKSAFFTVYNSFLKIKSVMARKGDVDFIWILAVGPLDYMLHYTMEETASFIEDQWTEQVLAKIEGASRDRVPQILFDKDRGLVWKFVSGAAGPFIGHTTTGYYSRKAFERSIFEQSIPFREDFLEFLDRGTQGIINEQSDYRVKLETLPISVNREARVEPYANILSIQCADGQAVLKNYNYPLKKNIRWAPDNCGDATLQILFPDAALTRTYPGKSGFARFLADFKTGSKTFMAEDFPEDKLYLQGQGIAWIKVSYKISGAAPVLQTLTKVPSNVPMEIIERSGGS